MCSSPRARHSAPPPALLVVSWERQRGGASHTPFGKSRPRGSDTLWRANAWQQCGGSPHSLESRGPGLHTRRHADDSSPQGANCSLRPSTAREATCRAHDLHGIRAVHTPVSPGKSGATSIACKGFSPQGDGNSQSRSMSTCSVVNCLGPPAHSEREPPTERNRGHPAGDKPPLGPRARQPQPAGEGAEAGGKTQGRSWAPANSRAPKGEGMWEEANSKDRKKKLCPYKML